MRRAYDRLKLCVFGNVNESGVSVDTSIAPSRFASVASQRVVVQADAAAVIGALTTSALMSVGGRRELQAGSYSTLPMLRL